MKAAPARKRAGPEAGFVLIEVLVSALVITIVAGAVLTLVSATTHSAATERAHADAYGLAQEDQAQLRSMRISSLEHFNNYREETLNGTKFQIHEQAAYVNNASGNESCTEGSSSIDYVRITSTVSSSTLVNPIVLQSIVSPTTGSVDPSHGTLSFGAKNAGGEPLAGVSISGTGPGTFSGSTDESGCANFADLPAGNYKVTTSAAGMINPKGETSTTQEIGVEANGARVVSLLYDQPSAVEPSFFTVVSGQKISQYVDSFELYNAESGSIAKTYGTPGGTRAKLGATNLFPFKTKYTIYAGSCESNNPDPNGQHPENDAAMAFVALPPGHMPEPNPAIQLPALNLTVTYQGAAVSGATVTATETTSKCSNVKRTYTTNTAGHLSSGSTGPDEPGLPWGKYKVCASLLVSTNPNKYRFIEEASVPVESLANTTLSLALPTTTGSSHC